MSRLILVRGRASGLRKRPLSSLTSVRESFSSAPSGLRHIALPSHGLRRGLHSYAASRLIIEVPAKAIAPIRNRLVRSLLVAVGALLLSPPNFEVETDHSILVAQRHQ